GAIARRSPELTAIERTESGRRYCPKSRAHSGTTHDLIFKDPTRFQFGGHQGGTVPPERPLRDRVPLLWQLPRISVPPSFSGLAVGIQSRLGHGAPGELLGTSEPIPSRIERAIASGSCGSVRMAAPPAISGMELTLEVTTGQAQAIASRIGSPKVSLNEGYTRRSAAR